MDIGCFIAICFLCDYVDSNMSQTNTKLQSILDKQIGRGNVYGIVAALQSKPPSLLKTCHLIKTCVVFNSDGGYLIYVH